MFQFDSIRWFNADLWWLLLPGLALIPAWVSYELFWRRVKKAFPGQRLVPATIQGSAPARRGFAFLCAFIALELLAVAAMRPRYGLKDFAVRGVGVDIAIVLDASRSMKVPDVVPDRIGKAQIEISRFLEAAKGNRVALVPFAGVSFIQSPLTLDHGVIRQYLTDLRVTDIPVPGTALGRALNTAARALGTGQDNAAGSTHKAIVVFTDGENHEGEPLEVAAELAQKGVRIFTVGVGTPEGQPIPVLDDGGSVKGLTRDSDGVTPVLSKLDEDLLKKIAEKTGGRYFPLSAGTEVSTALMKEIDALEKAEYMSAVERLLEDRFQYPLAAALVFMILPFLLTARWKRNGIRSTGAMAAIIAFTMTAQIPATAHAEPFKHPFLARLFNTSQGDVDKARELMAARKHSEAFTMLKELATKLPPSPALDLNLSLAAAGTGDFGAAAEYAESAIRRNDGLEPASPLKLSPAELLHARGTILAMKARSMSTGNADQREVRKIYRQALDSLVAALLLNPDGTDTRRNVEIVAAAAWPPCSSLDDAREPNGSRNDAAFLAPDPSTLEAREDLLLCPRDQDWFKLPVNPGETVFVSVEKPADPRTATPDQSGQEVGQAKAPEPADVDLTLELEDGSSLAAAVKHGRWTATGESGSTLIMQVTGPEVEDGVDYVLTARVVPPCPSGDDQLEPNDSREEPKPVEDGDLPLRICPFNDDWFQYIEKQGTTREIRLSSSNTDDRLELQVLSADGAAMDVRTEIGPEGTISSVLLPEAEQDAPFTIYVSGSGGHGFYNLSIKDPEGDQNQNDNNDDQQDRNDNNDRQEEQPKQQGSRTMRELIDSIDSNDRNLEAREAARNSPMGDSAPQKDW